MEECHLSYFMLKIYAQEKLHLFSFTLGIRESSTDLSGTWFNTIGSSCILFSSYWRTLWIFTIYVIKEFASNKNKTNFAMADICGYDVHLSSF